MNDVLVLMARLVSIFLIACVGFFISRKRILSENQQSGISLLLNRIALPMMIIASISRMKLDTQTLINSGIVILGTCLIYFFNYILSNFVSKKTQMPNKERSVFVNAAVHGNVAFLGFPLLLAVYGEEGLFYGSVFFMFDNVLMFSAGMRRLMRDYPAKKELAPVTYALIIGLVLMVFSNLSGFDLTNNPIYTGINDLGNITTPLAFLFVGMTVADYNLGELLKNKKSLSGLAITMVIVPIICIIVLLPLRHLIPSILLKVILVEALMPPYASLLSMAYEYQQDMKLASALVVIGHILSILTIPILFMIVNILYL